MVIPHLEIVGLIASLGIASFAAWSNAGLHLRVRLLERDLDIVTDHLRAMQHAPHPPQPRTHQPIAQPAVVPVPANVARVYAPFSGPSLAEQLGAAPGASGFAGEDRVEAEWPDVNLTASRLREQAPESVRSMLRPALSLTGNLPDLLRGREAKRLAEWINSTPSGR